MKEALLTLVLVALAICTPHGDDYGIDRFSQFIHDYNKEYTASEHSTRFRIFQDNLKRFEEHNQEQDASFFMDVNEFSDLTPSEFENKMLMVPISAESLQRMYAHIKVDNTTRSNDPLPTNFDWRDKGAVAPVKNQGACGSCWTYSTTGNIEGVNYIKHGQLVRLSQQQLIDCDQECGVDPVDGTKYCDGGCNGGWMMTAFQSIIKIGGIDKEEAYSFNENKKCEFNKEAIGAKLSSWKMLSTTEDVLARQLFETGPISVAFDASGISGYSRGIIKAKHCDPKKMTHAVLIVGFGEEDGNKYWIVKNSWGPGWGEDGYFRIERGANVCGIATVPCTSVVV
ncbi:cathepsin F [Acrasis kona]|uniref:Cathepsin F n=1 Tax=Acrasis kona TaxID=1008807 RepID=A0AAW2ZDA7_9EUKA